MIADTASMEFVTTATEIEALLLEANLIKRLKPRFNVVLRDDKSFPFILIARDHAVPQILKHRGARNRKGDYFGPFASAGAVGRTINTLQRAFLLRSCSDAYFETRLQAVPALPDQALQRALHRRDLCERIRPRWSTRRSSFLTRRERRGEATAACPDGRGEPEAGLRARGKLPRPADSAVAHPVAPGHQPADRQGGRCVRRPSGGRPDLHPGVLLPQRQQLGQPRLFPACRQDPSPWRRCSNPSSPSSTTTSRRRSSSCCRTISPAAACSPRRCRCAPGARSSVGKPVRGEKRDLVDHALINAREALARRLAESASQARDLRAPRRAVRSRRGARAHRGLRQQPHLRHQPGRRHDRRRT